MISRLSKVAIGLVVLGAAVASRAQDVPWQIDGGVAAVQFYPDNLRAYGVEVTNLNATAKGDFQMEAHAGFQIQRSSSMRFMTENQGFGHHMGGFLDINGGFVLRSGRRSVAIINPRIVANGAESTAPLTIQNGLSGAYLPTIDLNTPATVFDIFRSSLTIGWCDMKLSKSAANALGRPDAEGVIIGCFTIWSTAHPTVPIPKPIPGGDGGMDNVNADVSLHNLSSFTHQGRDGVAYPNGTSGFACLTTSCNKGTTNIDWFAPMNEEHPVIAQQLYRIRNGRIEQIGAAYLKHGFLALNTGSSSCGNPNGGSAGSQLFPGLTDTYSAGNNGDRFYLGPRSEVNPHTGVWTAFGSFFDVGTGGATPDGARSLTNSQVSAMPAHRNKVEVKDQDLIIPVGETRQYLFEAFYLCEQEINLQNQIGCKQTNLNWTGSIWSASDTGSYFPSVPAIDQYIVMTNATKNIPAGDVNGVSNKVNNLSEGWIYMACNPVRLGGGLWRYEITVFNYTSDRQIRELKVPMMPGMTVTSVGFRDVDATAGNDWAGTYSNTTGEIVWSTQTFAQNPNANSLKYGSMYNFTFTANVAPSANVGTLGLFKTGAVMTNSANGIAPPNGNVSPATAITINGTLISGGASNLANSDDSYLVIRQNPAQDTVHLTTTEVAGTSPIVAAGQIHVEIESRSDFNFRFRTVELWNYVQNRWDEIGSGFVGTTDSTETYSVVGANAANYVNATTRGMRARLNMNAGSQELTSLAEHRIDKMKWLVGL